MDQTTQLDVVDITHRITSLSTVSTLLRIPKKPEKFNTPKMLLSKTVHLPQRTGSYLLFHVVSSVPNVSWVRMVEGLARLVTQLSFQFSVLLTSLELILNN